MASALINKSYTGIKVNAVSGIFGGTITDSYIICGTVTYYSNNARVASFNQTGLLISPKLNQRSAVGINIVVPTITSSEVTVGSSVAGGPKNYFDNLSIGIYNTFSTLNVYNNNFSNINPSCRS